MSANVERFLLILLVAGIGFSAFFFISQRTGSNVLDMESKLNTDIATLATVPQEFFPRAQANYSEINKTLAEKKVLWQELIPPPVKVAAPPQPPNMVKKLAGVKPHRRKQIGSGENLRVHIISPLSKRGIFMGVGDAYKDMTIIAITKEYVEFLFIRNGEKFPHKVDRK